jgi:hypothetical protein
MTPQHALDKAHEAWERARFAGTEQTHEERALETLSGFLDLPIIQPRAVPWGACNESA